MTGLDGITKALKGEAEAPPYFFALLPASWAYSAVVRARVALYRLGLFETRRLPCRVISVGNITAGGTGKTPMVIHLAGLITGRGLKPAIVTRGYGGKGEGGLAVVSDGARLMLSQEEAGDEAFLLASRLPGVPVVMGSDRFRAGQLASKRFGPDVIILDDAYQRISLARDLNILLLDARHPFGNGHLLPMGYLREPESAAGRADAVIFTRSDLAEGCVLDENISSLLKLCPSAAVATSSHTPTTLYSLPDGRDEGLECLSGAKVFGFSGIADPASFALILNRLHVNITGLKAFPDHHSYTRRDMAGLASEAAASGADMLVTTEKDAVKLGGILPERIRVAALRVDISFTSGGELLDKLITDRVVSR